MTQRLVVPSRQEVDSELSVAHPWWQFQARFNVAISQSVPVVRMHERQSEGVMMRWGLAHKSPLGVVNFTDCGVVRSDVLQSAEEVRTAWLYGQRGIVPVAGFYVWQRAARGHQQPYYIRMVNRAVFGVAALWQRAETPEGDVFESCALISVDANALLTEIDPSGQMPGILQQKDYESWLSCTAVPQAKQLLQSCPPTQMVCHPVAPHVNHLEFDEPRLIQPISR